MSRLEQQTAPHLSAAILGQTVEWHDAQRTTVATWAAKTALMIDRTWPDHYVPLGLFHHVHDHLAPPPGSSVALTSLVYPPGRDFLEPALVHRRRLHIESPFASGYVSRFTFSVGYVIFQVVLPDPDLPDGIELRRTLTMNGSEVKDFLRQLWPLTSDAFAWPPGPAFDARAVADLLS